MSVLLNQGRTAVRVVFTLKKEDRHTEVRSKLIKIDLGDLRRKYIEGQREAADESKVVSE